MTEIGKSVISGSDTITSTSPWHYLDGNIRDKLRQSLLNFMEYKLPDIDDLSVLELHSAAITGASDLLESLHPYTWD
ncbi:uncharacterized protein PHACADRAFT_214697 [Phanerochaete carnosa HHB-10118-sp]|uniref:Uncharacterized protein n=1 Tax=Phanerochaete carnosa (strain HHB-10118-sp) TaxID=650164 RepID=K5VC85_PHACS|nr:uncharacterized protein PHACADRAFT_214697 [Phanerochaete carnosa HHB-10118-sp]EKM48703.1 hypothetical protein PHACADRAFT_214697 [Phanerochaete carnosa HHB-10118-sp]